MEPMVPCTQQEHVYSLVGVLRSHRSGLHIFWDGALSADLSRIRQRRRGEELVPSKQIASRHFERPKCYA